MQQEGHAAFMKSVYFMRHRAVPFKSPKRLKNTSSYLYILYHHVTLMPNSLLCHPTWACRLMLEKALCFTVFFGDQSLLFPFGTYGNYYGTLW